MGGLAGLGAWLAWGLGWLGGLWDRLNCRELAIAREFDEFDIANSLVISWTYRSIDRIVSYVTEDPQVIGAFRVSL